MPHICLGGGGGKLKQTVIKLYHVFTVLLIDHQASQLQSVSIVP
jgi:hypothetical protein